MLQASSFNAEFWIFYGFIKTTNELVNNLVDNLT